MRSNISKEKILIITTILVVSIVLIGIGNALFTANNPKKSTASNGLSMKWYICNGFAPAFRIG